MKIKRLWVKLVGLAAVLVLTLGLATSGSSTQSSRNVIFFHPDGYGLSHWTALRVYLAGPDGRLNWDQLPYWGLYTGAIEILSRNAKAAERGIFLVVEEEGTDDFPNANNARGSFEAGSRTDEALGVFAEFVKNNANTLLITTADSNAGGKQISGTDLQSMIQAGAVVEGNVTKTFVNTSPGPAGEGEWALAPLDGVDGAGTPVFWSAPDAAGVRHPFVVGWATNRDVVGDTLVRAKGLNAQRVSELGVVDSTDVYRIMYYTLFGRWLGSPSP